MKFFSKKINSMKAIYVRCNVVVKEDIMELLEKAKVSSYDVIPKTLYFLAGDEPRLDTPVWPGYNVSFIVFEKNEDVFRRLFELLREYNENCKFDEEKVTAYAFETQQLL
jgi:hypothetical protein